MIVLRRCSAFKATAITAAPPLRQFYSDSAKQLSHNPTPTPTTPPPTTTTKSRLVVMIHCLTRRPRVQSTRFSGLSWGTRALKGTCSHKRSRSFYKSLIFPFLPSSIKGVRAHPSLFSLQTGFFSVHFFSSSSWCAVVN